MSSLAKNEESMKKYVGELKLVGFGTIDHRYMITKYSVIEVGDNILKKILANQLISSFLNPGNVKEIYIGPLFFMNYIYALRKEDGQLIKMGIKPFIISLGIKLLFLFLGCLGVWFVPESYIGYVMVIFSAFLLYRSFQAITKYVSLEQ
jgi:hypothetical protein